MPSFIQFTDEHIIINNHYYDRKLIEKIIDLAIDMSIDNIVIDGFSGMGGVTEGFSRLSNWMVIACINHWDIAIETHKKNHPDCLHLLEDFRSADISILRYMVDEIRKWNPGVKIHCWFSLECTNFSNAKGGMSRDADSRTLADHTDRYIIDLDPDCVWIENVKEFQLWGPMIPKVVSLFNGKKKTQYAPKDGDAIAFYNSLIDAGHVLFCPLDRKKKKDKYIGPWMIPCPYYKGRDYKRWKDYTCSLGYDVETKLMNCADYGVPQHRIRLIMQFCRINSFCDWPVPTHDKKGANGLPKWLPVKPCLDLEDEGESVLSFKMQKGKLVPRIKSKATIDRLISGCDKHVIDKGESNFIVKYLSNNENTGSNSGASVDNTSPVVTCQNRLGIAKAHMIDHYFGNGYTKSVDEPAGVSGTKDGISLHTVQFLSTYHSVGNGSSIESIGPAVMTKDKYPLVSVERFIMDTQFNNAGHSLDQPAKTQTANRKHFYLVNFQWFNKNMSSVENPSNTIIARLDKSPNYLITIETGELAIAVFEEDPPHYVKLKKYMAENGIIGINMRMLKEIELLKIMSMTSKKKLSRSSTANKKMIGNAVPPDLVEQLGKEWGKKETHKKVA